MHQSQTKRKDVDFAVLLNYYVNKEGKMKGYVFKLRQGAIEVEEQEVTVVLVVFKKTQKCDTKIRK